MSAARSITKAFQWDLARQVERLDFLLKWLPRYAEWGYEELYLHLDDAVEYPSLPGVARSDAFTHRQLERLVAAALRAGIKVVPIVNLLGHTQYLIKTPELRDLNELRDAAGRPLARGQICPRHPRTLEIAGKLLRDVAPFCTAGKVHVGLDESFHLGQCPRCRAEIAQLGMAGHFAGHVARLHELTQSLGLRLGLWADMLALLPAAIPLLPRDVIAYDWYYYPFARHPRVELYNFAEADLATPLQARGIEYWGCPMNGAFRYEPLPVFGERLANIFSWWKRCRRVGAGGFLITSWEANRLAIELTTTVDAAAASLWLEPEVDDPGEMLARGFARVFGSTKVARVIPNAPRRLGDKPHHLSEVRRWARVALAGDEYAFAGYHRWQINDRWDVCAGRDGAAAYERELRALERICRSLLAGDSVARASCRWPGNHGRDARATSIHRLPAGSYKVPPPALAASFAFRRYLAQRDVFVRRNAQAVFKLRRMLISPVAASACEWMVHAGPLAGARRHLRHLRTEADAFAAALRAGRAAARAMWRRSRDPRVRGPNELMVERDAGRLRDWQEWLGQVERNPARVWQATPVCGAWQLLFTVHNFAPAMQQVVVEQQQADGAWVTLYGLHTIEFRAEAARRRTRIRREFSVPVPAAVNASKPTFPNPPLAHSASSGPRACRGAGAHGYEDLRIAVRGLGQVAVSDVELTNGVERRRPRGWPRGSRKRIGKPAPWRGFPQADFEENAEMVFLAGSRWTAK